MKTTMRFVLLAAAALTMGAAAAQTLYKLIDKNGKVTYSEEKPKNFDGQVIQLDINPNANTAILPKPAASQGAGEGGRTRTESPSPRKSDGEARVAQAQAKLEEAKRAFQELSNNPGPDDLRWIGT